MRQVIVGGAPMPRPLLGTWLARDRGHRGARRRRLLLDPRPRQGHVHLRRRERVPAEVEEAPAGHEAIAEAAVAGVPDQRWGETGPAFVVFGPGRALPPEELAGYCRARLAAYKVPAHFRTLAELPRLTSGKIDKITLRPMLADPSHGGEDVS